MRKRKIIVKGDKFETKNSGHAFGNQVLTVTYTVEAESKDGFICFRLENKVKGRRNIKARVWWFNDFCRRIK